MAKDIKRMQMEVLKNTFTGVNDFVFLSMTGLDAITENSTRLALRKKKIRLQLVKNSLARRVFGELGVKVKSEWAGPTVIAWGGDSLATLSKEIEAIAKTSDKVKPKWAICEGQEISFAQALTMPTREGAIGRVIGMVAGVGGRLVSQILGPAGSLASQIKEVAKKEEAAPAA